MFNTIEAKDGVEALEILDKEKIDIIIADYIMPNMNGIELLIEVRKKHKKEEIAFIAETSKANPEILTRFLKYGADSFIYKPFVEDEFKAIINKVMDYKFTLEENKQKQKEIKKINQHTTTLIEVCIDPLITITKNGIIQDVNNAGIKMIGYAKETLIGTKFSSYFENQNDANEIYTKILQDGEVLNYPLHFKDKHGRLKQIHCNATTYKNEKNEIEGIFMSVRDMTEIMNLKTKLEKLALYDELTNLPNRRLLNEMAKKYFSHSLRVGEKISVVFIDLNKFKPINDSYGHNTGDEVIKEVALRLSNNFRQEDIISRIGGDEFVILIPKSTDEKDDLKAKILKLFDEPFISPDNSLSLQILMSVGIATYPEDGKTFKDLLLLADKLMYENKENGSLNDSSHQR